MLRTAKGEEILKTEPENLYHRSVRNFVAAINGAGAPSASGEDGIKSMGIAIAALKAAKTGRETTVEAV